MATESMVGSLLVLIGLLGGAQAFGTAGLLLGPVLISVDAGLLRNQSGIEPAVKSWPQPKAM